MEILLKIDMEKEIEDLAYYFYTHGMKSKWIKCVPRENFDKSIHGYEQYIEAAEWIIKRKKEKENGRV
jgi:hypothetical protein